MKTPLKVLILFFAIVSIVSCTSQKYPTQVRTDRIQPSNTDFDKGPVKVSENQTLMVETYVAESEIVPEKDQKSSSKSVKKELTEEISYSNQNVEERIGKESRERINAHVPSNDVKGSENISKKRKSKLAKKIERKLEKLAPDSAKDNSDGSLLYWILVIILILLILTLLRSALGALYGPLVLIILIVLIGHLLGLW